MASAARRLLSGWLLLGWLAAWNACAAEDFPPSAPLFSAAFADLEDRPATLEHFRGQALVVNFWARWCGPCREEIPEFVKARQRFHGVEVVGIALDDKAVAVREFASAYGIDYPVFLAKDKGIELIQALGNNKAGLPFTLVVDRQGKVIYTKLGVMKPADMDAAFKLASQAH